MNRPNRTPGMNRREFCAVVAGAGATAALGIHPLRAAQQQVQPPEKPATNRAEALKHPRKENSMPGKYPGRVVRSVHEGVLVNNAPDPAIVDTLVSRALLTLTGAANINEAWRAFVSPDDIIGLKVNPVAGKLLSTSPEIVAAIIGQLQSAGIPRDHLVIWDRREFELQEVGFTAERFPGIKIIGTERKDAAGSFTDDKGKLYGEAMIDRDWFYWADVEEQYDAETLPYMINGGKYSYFSRIVTQDVTKIINIPILKNAGTSITLCLKNLAYGAISNTQRLHKQLWSETTAEVPAFPPLRDKVVLNIVDGIRGCFNGGPGANPQFFSNYNTVLAGTDPVAVDRIGYDIVLKKRLEEKVQKEESPRGRLFLDLAAAMGLGEADISRISLTTEILS